MRELAILAAFAVFARLFWKRQLHFEQELCTVVADFQTETLGLVEEYFEGGEVTVASVRTLNGSRG